MMLLSRIVLAEPRVLPVLICRMKPGMSMDVGQALMQGASWQNRHLALSARAWGGIQGQVQIPKILEDGLFIEAFPVLTAV
jgi:hypothetical protein